MAPFLRPRPRRTRAGAVLGLGAALTAAAVLAAPAPAPATPAPATSAAGSVAAARAADHPAVVETRLLGRSSEGRPIRAYRLGEPARAGLPTVVLIAVMHGDERAPRRILTTLVDGEPIIGADLWIVPTYNPDGAAANRRTSATGVDLNRNYPYRWADLDGHYESGPRPASEPETRAMMGFLADVDPDYVLSFHQPLRGVDTQTKSPAFSKRVARALHLPRSSFTCGSTCHGTMTMWFNHRFDGVALTVEYGAHPTARTLTRQAPAALLRLFGAQHGSYDIGPVPDDPATPSPRG